MIDGLGAISETWRFVTRPFRKAGLCGTPDKPKYLNKGEMVPRWVLLAMPLSVRPTCGTDAETYFDGKYQVIRPVSDSLSLSLSSYPEDEVEAVIFLREFNGWAGIAGAPTSIQVGPRFPPRRRFISETYGEKTVVTLFPKWASDALP